MEIDDDEKDLVKIVVLDDEVQAELVEAVLVERDIPHVMRSYSDSAWSDAYQGAHGWGHIDAPEECRDEILAIVDEVKAGGSVSDDDALSDPNEREKE